MGTERRLRWAGMAITFHLSEWRLGWCQSDDDLGPRGAWWLCVGPIAFVFDD